MESRFFPIGVFVCERWSSSDLCFSLSNADPTIIIEGQDGFQITYPPNESGGLFFVNVYTTSELKSFDVVNNDELTSFKISVIFYSYPMFQVVAKYQVKIPKVPRGVTQNYTIHVVNEDNRAASQKIQILMADSKWYCVIA